MNYNKEINGIREKYKLSLLQSHFDHCFRYNELSYCITLVVCDKSEVIAFFAKETHALVARVSVIRKLIRCINVFYLNVLFVFQVEKNYAFPFFYKY